jgi:uncharacterized membrane protein YeiB
MLLLAPRLGRALLPLSYLGSMTLTLYTMHVLAVADEVGPGDPQQLWVVHIVVALLVATAWRLAHARGPLEQLLSWPSRAVAVRVATGAR